MDIDPRTPHVPLINTEQLLGVEKTSFQYSPDISCMCLLRGLNGHIRVICLASRQSASSWRPKLPCSSLDTHWPPLEAWYLGCIRIASQAGVYPLTCEEAEGGGACRVMLRLRSRVRPLWLLLSAPPPSPSPPLDANQLSQPQPHPNMQKYPLATTSSQHLAPSMSSDRV